MSRPAATVMPIAYVVVDADRTVLEPGYDASSHPNPLPRIGDVFAFEERLPESYIRDEIDGPVRDVIHLQRVVTAVGWKTVGGEKQPYFTDQGARVLALLQIGAENERVLRERLHAITEEVRDLVANVFAGHDDLGAVLSQLDTIEQRFVSAS